MQVYAGVVAIFLMSILVGIIFIVLSSTLGPKRPNPSKNEPFECGQAPFKMPVNRLPVKFYMVAMLFIIFDVELIFFFPWAVVLQELGMYAFLGMLPFFAILVVGLAYEWREGALEWNRMD